MKKTLIVFGVALALSLFLVSGCLNGAPSNQTKETGMNGEEGDIEENTEENTNGTVNEEPNQTQEEETQENVVEEATSIDMKIKDVTDGELTSDERIRYKNIGQDNAKLRIDKLASPEKTWILDKEQNKGWFIMDGDVQKFSNTSLDFSNQWETSLQMFDSWKTYLETQWEEGEDTYGYSTEIQGVTTNITIYDVEIDPDFSESVFQPS